MTHPHAEPLEPRQLFAFTAPMPPADLRADTNRDGVINGDDDAGESVWSSGKGGRGAVVLPNVDRDNTAPGGAPDNWIGGVWNGRPVAPNNVIDNAADLADVGRLRLRKFGAAIDAAYNYRVTIKLIRPASDPAWFANTAATDRVRVFFPSLAKPNGDVALQAGDVAVLGPGLGDTIRFVRNPVAANEYSVMDLAGDGWFEFGVEGIKAGAQVRFQVTVEYDPLIVFSLPAGGGGGVDEPVDPPAKVDTVAMRVAPFVLTDHGQRAQKVLVENMNRYPGFDNSATRAALKSVFGDRLVETRTGDLWQQDGYEIGYAKTPYGAMPVVLELPRAGDHFFDPDANMRSYVRGTLLGAGLGVMTDVATLPNDTASAFGGDIETLPRGGGKPGYLLSSGMPTKLRNFFEAQATNPLLDLKLDDWLGVGHVDEVVQATPDGKRAVVADADLAWALSLLAVKLDPNVRAMPGMNGHDQLPGYTAEGVKLATLLANADFRRQNLEYAGSSSKLGAVRAAVKAAMGLTEEVTAPALGSGNAGTAKLARGGAFAALLGNAKRTFEVRFVDGDRYRLRYRDGTGAWSGWADGRRSQDEVFPAAKAYLLKHYWTGTPKAGDTFTFATNPAATLVRMPVLFATGGLFFGPPIGGAVLGGGVIAGSVIGDGKERLVPYSTNYVNSVVDGTTVVAGKGFGPRVNWSGAGKSDLYDGYAAAAFKSAGYTRTVFADTRLYHDASGGIHCGTNVIRAVPAGKWWEA
ncbi:MAG TPA: protein-arginine deiminase family protein [Humisphaera sp.]